MIRQAREMNERGRTHIETWNYHHTSRQEAALQRTLDTARKKILRDYRTPGGSSIVFVFDRSLFWDDNPKHSAVLTKMMTELAVVPLLADHVLLMFILGDQKQIVEIKRIEQEN